MYSILHFLQHAKNLQFLLVKRNSSSYNRWFTNFFQGKSPFQILTLQYLNYTASRLGFPQTCGVPPLPTFQVLLFILSAYVQEKLSNGWTLQIYVLFLSLLSFSLSSLRPCQIWPWTGYAFTPWLPQPSIEVYMQSITGHHLLGWHF